MEAPRNPKHNSPNKPAPKQPERAEETHKVSDHSDSDDATNCPSMVSPKVQWIKTQTFMRSGSGLKLFTWNLRMPHQCWVS